MGRSPWTPVRTLPLRWKLISGGGLAGTLLLAAWSRTSVRPPLPPPMVAAEQSVEREPVYTASAGHSPRHDTAPPEELEATEEDEAPDSSFEEPGDPDDLLMPPHEEATEDIPITID